jgi:hypothetical protein
VTAHEALDGENGLLRICDGLALSDLADKALTGFGEGDYRGGGAGAFLICDDGRLTGFHDGHDGIRRSKVDTNDFAHFVLLKDLLWMNAWSAARFVRTALALLDYEI